MAFDPIGFKFPKVKVSDGGAGYAEPGAVYTFDGNAEGKEIYDWEVKIADVAPDLNNLVKVVSFEGGQQLEIKKADFEVVTADGGQAAVYQETAMVAVYDGALWVFCNPEAEGYYVSRIEFAETIHTIDPKYLPSSVATKADIFGAMEASY